MFPAPTEDQVECISDVAITRIQELLSACGNDDLEVCWYAHIVLKLKISIIACGA